MTDYVEQVRLLPEGWVRAMGITFTKATEDEVCAELEVDERHLQAYGIVHGGLHCGIIETLCSLGAAIWALPQGRGVVGLENHTSFLRAVRAGTRLTAVATPVQRGRRAQVWQGDVHDGEGRLVASGRVRLLCLERGSELAGEPVPGMLTPP